MGGTPMEKQRSAIIIGAGVGGVATAARLAKAGFNVTVVEKNDFTGGRCSLIHHDGYRFDQGPSLLLLPRFFAETYADLDTSLASEGIELLKCEPNYHIWFADGAQFRLSTDLARMKAEVEKWEGKDGFSRYLAFMREAHAHYELSVTHVLKRNFTSLLSMARPEFLMRLFQLHPFESIYARASRYFWTERLRRVFTFGSMYMGMSPFEAPGTYSLLQYTELAEGIWYPRGGFNRVIQGIVDIGTRFGVNYRLSSTVRRIILSPDGHTATGVELVSGEKLMADLVICNADLVYAYNNLLPSSSYATSLSKRPASCSSISFYWALDRCVPEFQAHNIFLAEHYQESFDSIFKCHLIPEEPSFYVNVPSRVDPSAAPEGKDAIVVLVPVGHLLSNDDGADHKGTPGSPNTSPAKTPQNWERMIEFARRTVLSIVAARTGVNLAPHIDHEIINDPATWQEKFNLDRGAILGLSHSFFNVLSFRPKTKHPNIHGLYFVGASTHPGTGVPICLAGGKIVAEQILEDESVAIPWANGRSKRSAQSGALDIVKSPPLVSQDLVLGLISSVIVMLIAVGIMAALMSFSDHSNIKDLQVAYGEGSEAFDYGKGYASYGSNCKKPMQEACSEFDRTVWKVIERAGDAQRGSATLGRTAAAGSRF
ncbi:phytoene dehydrogenase [Rhizodiscina lignyota]|uniref:Phytoene desaturase n=1 Tax=Rhizodiscina lignyota TaxID=1504668 RepID=A0A9P4IQ24_9PEZI|nr:phytoene dehydrogenase [Rhizodiscina lignyota]